MIIKFYNNNKVFIIIFHFYNNIFKKNEIEFRTLNYFYYYIILNLI